MEVVSLEVGLGGCIGVLWLKLGVGLARRLGSGRPGRAGAAPT